MLTISMEALRSRSLAGFPVLLIAMLLVVFPSEANRAMAQGSKQATSVFQLNGTPSGVRGQSVLIEAGLNQAPRSGTGYWTCLQGGEVKLYINNGGRWKYLGKINAAGCSGSLDTWATASFVWPVPKNQPKGLQPFKFEYEGNQRYRPSQVFGSVWIP